MMSVRAKLRAVLHLLLALSMLIPAGSIRAAVQVYEAGTPTDTRTPTSEREGDDIPADAASNPDIIPFDPEVPVSEAADTVLSMGIATYQIPIEVPKGRGVSPRLAIRYNSFQKNGFLGVGWDLLGAGYIQRATKHGLNWTGNDFVVHASGSASELVPRIGAPWGGTGHYGAKIEGSFMNYYLEAPEIGWKVRDKNGTVYRYGSRPTSRQWNSEGIFRWYLDRVTDINGNYMDITYQCGDECGDNGEVYPGTITYTKHASGPNAANTILFNLEAREDKQIAHGDRNVRTTRRLAGIEITARNEPVRKYVLNYEYSPKTARSLLKSVAQYGSDYGAAGAQPLVTKTFDWQPESTDYSGALQQMSEVFEGQTAVQRFKCNGNAEFTHFQALDLNKDGYADFVYDGNPKTETDPADADIRVYLGPSFSTSQPWSKRTKPLPQKFRNFQFGDVDGDGYPDLAYIDTSNDIHVLLNIPHDNGRKFKNDGPGIQLGKTPTSRTSFKFIDVNGDGLTDIIYDGDDDTQGDIRVLCANGSGGFNQEEHWGTRAFQYETYSDNDYKDYRMADVNGDGLPDFLYCAIQGISVQIHVLLNNGSGFEDDEYWIARNRNYTRYLGFQMADMNGDGLADFIYDGWSNVDLRSDFMVHISKGYGFEESKSWGYRRIDSKTQEQFNYAWDAPYFFMTDLNNDGLSDLVWVHSFVYTGPIYIHLNSGDKLNESQEIIRNENFGNGFRLSDVTGDGLPDFVSDDFYIPPNTAGGGYYGMMRVRPSQGSSPDLVRTIKNGIGGSYTFEYQNSSACLETNLPYTLKIVNSITAEDGTLKEDGNLKKYTTSYEYSGGKHSYPDREFLGFEKITKTMPDATVVVSNFHQEGAKKGLLLNQTTSKDGLNYHQVENVWREADLPAGAKFPYLYQASEHLFDKQATSQTVVTDFKYDAYGNATEKHRSGVGVTTGVSVSRSDYTSYEPYDTAYWIVAAPTFTYTRAAPGSSDNSDLARTYIRYYPRTNLVSEKELWLKVKQAGETNPVISFEYDEYGNLRRQRDPNGNFTLTIYDAATKTFPARVTSPPTENSTHTATFRYDEDNNAGYRFGKPTSTTDVENNLTTRFKYDQFGRMSQKFDPNAVAGYATIEYLYNDSGVVGWDAGQYAGAKFREIRNQNTFLYKYSYFDGFGREIRVKSGWSDPLVCTDTEYGSHGKVRYKSLPYFLVPQPDKKNIWYAYDAMGRVTKQQNPDGAVLETVYNRDLTTCYDAEGNRKIERRDPFGRVIKVREYPNKSDSEMHLDTQYFYDTLGNLTAIEDSQGHQTIIGYDTLSRRTSLSDPVFGDWIYRYDANGNLEHQTYRRSETEDIEVWYEYDGLNRPIVKKYPDPEVQPDVQYFYDESGRANGVGRLTGVIDASGQSSFDYDYAGRVTASSTRVNIGGQLTDAYTLNRTYDALGRISTITYPAPDNETIQYGYDNNGNLGSVTRVGGACYAAFSDYNAAGQPGNIQFYNGASTLLEYYPSNNRLKSVTTNANDLVQEIRYTAYDKNGNVKSIEDGSEAVKTFAYGYDGLNRLRTADSSAYGDLEHIGLDYAGVGNIWKNSITGTDTFPAERELVYDYDNRLAAINTDSGMSTFVYNYQGERVIKQSGNSTTIYIGGLFEEKDGERIKHLFAGDRRIVSRIGSAAYYYHPDHLGGLSVITNSDGDVTQKAAYYPFGQQIDPGVETDPLPYRFTGQELDTETGLYYYKSRYYDPMIGRFISPDPLIQAAFDPPSFPRLITSDYGAKEAPIYAAYKIQLTISSNPYSYAGNNPINRLDLLGLAPGDLYRSRFGAGVAAILDFNKLSIANKVEYGGIIYYDPRTSTYSYTKPNIGGYDWVNPITTIPEGTERVAFYHTHAAYDRKYTSEVFSTGENEDIYRHDHFGLPGFLGTPKGYIRYYEPVIHPVYDRVDSRIFMTLLPSQIDSRPIAAGGSEYFGLSGSWGLDGGGGNGGWPIFDYDLGQWGL
ncbi:MAG: FG-GAP-like repeat-containing protein [Syntrophobacteraceae bacterium]